MLRDHGDPLFDPDGIGGNVEAHDGGRSGGGNHAGDQYADAGGFAGAVGAEESENFAAADFECDAIDGVGFGLLVALHQVANFDGRGLYRISHAL
jgi:hypothetical protein